MMRGVLVFRDARWLCQRFAARLALLETAGNQELAIGGSGEAMNGRDTAYRIDNFVPCGVDDDDLALSTKRQVHERLDEGRLHAQHEGGIAPAQTAGRRMDTVFMTCFSFSPRADSLRADCWAMADPFLDLDRTQSKRVADHRYGRQAHGRRREDR